jgi:hypothetical protein
MGLGKVIVVGVGLIAGGIATKKAGKVAEKTLRLAADNEKNVFIQPVEKKIIIKCDAENLSRENFAVSSRLKDGKFFLQIEGYYHPNKKGAKIVNRTYRLKKINPDDVKNATFDIVGKEIVVTIPITTFDEKMSVKYIG